MPQEKVKSLVEKIKTFEDGNKEYNAFCIKRNGKYYIYVQGLPFLRIDQKFNLKSYKNIVVRENFKEDYSENYINVHKRLKGNNGDLETRKETLNEISNYYLRDLLKNAENKQLARHKEIKKAANIFSNNLLSELGINLIEFEYKAGNGFIDLVGVEKKGEKVTLHYIEYKSNVNSMKKGKCSLSMHIKKMLKDCPNHKFIFPKEKMSYVEGFKPIEKLKINEFKIMILISDINDENIVSRMGIIKKELTIEEEKKVELCIFENGNDNQFILNSSSEFKHYDNLESYLNK